MSILTPLKTVCTELVVKVRRSGVATKFVRFVLSGSISMCLLFASFYVLYEWMNVWYLFASSVAFFFTLVVNFLLQKFWAFRSFSTRKIPKQFVLFFAFACMNFAINIFGMYALVDVFGFEYLLAQFIITGFIAAWDFVVYLFLIFPHKEDKETILKHSTIGVDTEPPTARSGSVSVLTGSRSLDS